MRNAVFLTVATVAGALIGYASYLLAVTTGLIVANEPCGSYVNPYSCLQIDVRFPMIFLAAGGTSGFLFYLVNIMRTRLLGLRVELGFGLQALV